MDAARVPGRDFAWWKTKSLIQMLATEYLEDAGFTVDAAGSATEAMNKLALIPGGVDAVIIDIGLPDRRGDDLVREILAMYSSLPIVLATGQDLATYAMPSKARKSPLSPSPTPKLTCSAHFVCSGWALFRGSLSAHPRGDNEVLTPTIASRMSAFVTTP